MHVKAGCPTPAGGAGQRSQPVTVLLDFGVSGLPFGDKWSISGSIDRVTGEVDAAEIETDRTGKTFPSTAYSLKCRPTQ
jgi:hypothetical protein